MPRRPLDLLRPLFLAWRCCSSATWLRPRRPRRGTRSSVPRSTAVVPGNLACRITGGPGCNTKPVPASAASPRPRRRPPARAWGLPGTDRNATRPDCQVCDGNEAQTLTPPAGFTQPALRVADAQAQFPAGPRKWRRIACGGPATRPAASRAALVQHRSRAPARCSFAAATAPASCATHGSCAALTCNVTRADCRARDAQEAQAWMPNASFISFARLTAATGGQGGGSTSGGGSTGSGSGSTPAAPRSPPSWPPSTCR